MMQVNIKVEAHGVTLARLSRPRLKRRKDVMSVPGQLSDTQVGSSDQRGSSSGLGWAQNRWYRGKGVKQKLSLGSDDTHPSTREGGLNNGLSLVLSACASENHRAGRRCARYRCTGRMRTVR